MLAPARVLVPGSTSNLGAGFDTVGVAVRRYLEARFEPGGTLLVLEREGTLVELEDEGDDDLLVRAFVGEVERLGQPPPAGRLVVSSQIPVGVGLGSSGAAVAGGLLLAAAASGEEQPQRARLLSRAVAIEGHADNAGPSLFGGLVAVVPSADQGLRAIPLRMAPGLAFAFAAPKLKVSTAAARRALPDSYPRPTAVRALGRLAALLHGLTSGDVGALTAGFQDELHVPYRLPLIPGGALALGAAREAGAWGATISGSGSGILAVCAPALQKSVAEAMADAFRGAGPEVVEAFALDPETRGGEIGASGASTVLHRAESR